MKLNCLIVDDEPMARGIIRNHLYRLDAFVVVGECSNAFETINALQTQAIDVLFLDIRMPELSGLELLKTLSHPPAVVLTTAYSDYAVDSYNYQVIDYLLKPITFERLLKTTNRLLEKFRHQPLAQPPEPSNTLAAPAPVDVLFFKSDKKIYKVNPEAVLYVQGWGNYVKVFTMSQGVILTLQTMGEVEQTLPATEFIRVHKSYIIAKRHIRFIEGNRISIGDEEIPVGLTYRHRLEQLRF